MKFVILIICFVITFGCKVEKKAKTPKVIDIEVQKELKVGADRNDLYLPLLNNKKVGVVLNQTSIREEQHMLDYLLAQNVNVTKIFALEHGIRGTADAGEVISDGKDVKSGIPIVSLYGSNKKPTKEQLNDIDVVLFDIQDVGVRFYTYISSLDYIMQACIESNKTLLVLDRPNPHAHYVDGPVLDLTLKSFVGMHKVPTVYGMTIGEYAKMIDGERWHNLEGKCDLTVIPCENYDRNIPYILPIKPSPNLPNHRSIMFYPSICLFEGTHVSLGRGTNKQFQQIGIPGLEKYYAYSFTPSPNEGAKDPPQNGKVCHGLDLSDIDIDSIHTKGSITYQFIIDFYVACKKANIDFFIDNNFFDKLAGNTRIKQMIIEGKSNHEIRQSYQQELDEFRIIREKYLLY
jgi:uncharacterized protein YbbC (DUF1343 family)